jgi:hypothetical protein
MDEVHEFLLFVGHEVIPPLYQRRVVMVPDVLNLLYAAVQQQRMQFSSKFNN